MKRTYRPEDALQRAFFPVEKRQAVNQKGDKVFALVDPVDQKVISEVSDKYTLVDNKTLVQPFVNRFGMPSKVTEYANRKSYLFEFMTGRTMDFGNGDIIKEKLIIANSYDKTKSFSFFFGAFRMVCTNGLFTAMASAITFKKIHVGEIPVADLVKAALENYGSNNFEFWKRLHDKPLTVKEEVKLIEKWVPFNFEKPEDGSTSPMELANNRVKNMATTLVSGDENVNNQRNAWGLFNQLNQAIRREFPGTKSIAKRIQGDTRSEKYLAEALKV